MKSFAHKLLACTFIIGLATGCASVTDAGMNTQPDSAAKTSVQKPKPNNPGFDSEQDMSTILHKPE